MAIDTEAKRRSTLGTWAIDRVLPVPDGSDADSASQRSHMYVYSGLVVAAPPAGGTPVKMIYYKRRRL